MPRHTQVTIQLEDDTTLSYEVGYAWSGRYRRATMVDPEEHPSIEDIDAELVEVNDEVPTQQQALHYGDMWQRHFRQFIAALLRADAEAYPHVERQDIC